jgi:hypothetical protein
VQPADRLGCRGFDPVGDSYEARRATVHGDHDHRLPRAAQCVQARFQRTDFDFQIDHQRGAPQSHSMTVNGSTNSLACH